MVARMIEFGSRIRLPSPHTTFSESTVGAAPRSPDMPDSRIRFRFAFDRRAKSEPVWPLDDVADRDGEEIRNRQVVGFDDVREVAPKCPRHPQVCL
jgi:hypothetical protein